MLVPLTQSLYVPGELASTETVLVDVGTGYFVEVGKGRPMPSASASAAYTRTTDGKSKSLLRQMALVCATHAVLGVPSPKTDAVVHRKPWSKGLTTAKEKST
jgi:hypothetical protein